jgi:NitT/TauT family transport system ATP-binding protein
MRTATNTSTAAIVGGDREPDRPPVSIELQGVSKTYATDGGSVVALADVTKAIPGGQFISLLGPSGCGKSTLLRLIAGLEPCSTGRIVIDGRPVDGPHAELGMAFQHDLLLPWRDVTANVLLQSDVRGIPRKQVAARAQQLLEQVGLAGFEHSLPRELSGGMRQRVALCRTLLHQPRLMLLDEPYAALDAMTRDQMALDLVAITAEQRTTVVFVTHSIPEAVFLSDRVLVMSARPGRIVTDIEIDLPSPRQLHVRSTPAFAAYVDQITGVFEELGILREQTHPPEEGA